MSHSYLGAVLPSIERRFGFTSTKLGTVKAMNDVSGCSTDQWPAQIWRVRLFHWDRLCVNQSVVPGCLPDCHFACLSVRVFVWPLVAEPVCPSAGLISVARLFSCPPSYSYRECLHQVGTVRSLVA